MGARDFRGLVRPAPEALRRRPLFLVEQEGMSQGARVVGVHRQAVTIRLRRWRERGEDGALAGRRVSPRPWHGWKEGGRTTRIGSHGLQLPAAFPPVSLGDPAANRLRRGLERAGRIGWVAAGTDQFDHPPLELGG